MYIGVSTASLYPMITEDALIYLASNEILNIELFINAEVEFENEIRNKIKSIIEKYHINILSVHPLPTYEDLYIFSDYERRKEYAIEMYKKILFAASEWGANYFTIHGARKESPYPFEDYLETYFRLYELGKSFGITIAQENVHYCKSGEPNFLINMSKALGSHAKFVLDIKQAVRAGYSVFDFLDAVGEKTIHIHASDNNNKEDCLPIGHGDFNFRLLFNRLKSVNYQEGIVVELYRKDFKDPSELIESAEVLKKIAL